MRIIRKIQFTGKNLNDVFALPCVYALLKQTHGELWLMLRVDMTHDNYIARIGHTLVEYDDGTWDIEK